MFRLPAALGADGARRATVHFELDGQARSALQGDTVLTAILVQASALRASDASGQPRAGFCLMGACQDCWVHTTAGLRLRACSTLVSDGLRLVTGLPVDGGAGVGAGVGVAAAAGAAGAAGASAGSAHAPGGHTP